MSETQDIDADRIFAAQRYAAYEKQLREESAAVPMAEYAPLRAALLQSYLDRPVIYESETMREIYEEQARFNLEEGIKRLQQGKV